MSERIHTGNGTPTGEERMCNERGSGNYDESRDFYRIGSEKNYRWLSQRSRRGQVGGVGCLQAVLGV